MTAMRLALALALCGPCLAATTANDFQVPSFSSAGLVNAASGQAAFAPYSICSIYGTGFLEGTAAANSSDLPYTLGGVTVLIGGIRAGLFYVSANQINLLIPDVLSPGNYSITVAHDGLASDPPVPIVLQEVAPGLFAALPGFAAAFHFDGTPVTGNSPAVPGEVAVFYATGLGHTQSGPTNSIVHMADFQLLLDGTAIDPSLVQYAGLAPNYAGLYQINVRLPDSLSATDPEVQVSIAGMVSPNGLRLNTSSPADAPPPLKSASRLQ
jgi:uncharacterized protein (TIGR03437 family)